MDKKKIMVVDDEPDIREILQFNLENAGYSVISAVSAETALEMCDQDIDLILLDVMMEGMSGFKMAEILRKEKKSQIPIIFLTARSAENDLLTGFSAGGDDYIAKPFGMRELVARINANLRKHTGGALPTVITVAEVTINDKEHEVYVSGEPVQLTLKEYNLLHLLMENADVVVKRETLLYRVWGYDYYGETRTLDMHIKSLRRKLGETAAGKHIVTVRGVGYKFSSE